MEENVALRAALEGGGPDCWDVREVYAWAQEQGVQTRVIRALHLLAMAEVEIDKASWGSAN